MTNRQQPHPQRCDTCRWRKPPLMDQCAAYREHSIDCFEAYFDDFTSIVGCASHSSAAEPEWCCDIEIIKPQPECFGHWKGINSDCNCHIWGYCADVTIRAQAEREKVLDAFAKIIQQRYVGKYDNEAGDIPEVPVDELADIIQSLRSGGK